jgi:hypothetical protein
MPEPAAQSADAGASDYAAKIAALERRVHELSQEAAGYRHAKKEAEGIARAKADEAAAAERAKAEAEGNWHKLHKIEAERAKALEEQLLAVKPKADRYESYLERRRAEVEAKKATLPAYLQALVDRVDVEDAAQAIEQWQSEQSAMQGKAPPPHKPAPLAGAPSSPPVPVDLTRPSVDDLKRLKATDPARYAALLRGDAGTQQSGLLARLTGAGRR